MVVRSIAAITQAPARTAEPGQTGATEAGNGSPRADGKAQPQSGGDLPATRPIDAVSIAEAAARLQELVRESSRALEFRVDDSSGRTVITVTNEATGEVVRQIPSEEVLALARSLGKFGKLLDSEV